jgi:hypothetical protein
MTYQTGRNALVAYKVESAFGTLPGATSGKVFRPNSGALNLTKEPIQSNENRRDGQMTRGRHGSRTVNAQYAADLSLGSYDDFIEAVFRGTFASELVITEATASLTSITTTANTIVAGGGSWITAGLRVGDVIRLTNHATAANNGKNIRITGLTSTTITTAETLTENATPDTAFTITRPKKLVMGTTARSFTLEERDIDIDGSKVGKGIRWGQMQLDLQPNGMAIVTFTGVGQDLEVMTGSSSPYFTDPTATTSLGMTAVEAVIRLGTGDVLDVSSLSLTINLNAAGQPVVGSVLTPDVFTNQAMVEGSITALKQDFNRMEQFIDEDQLSLHLLFTENESEPKDFCSFFIGNLTLASATDSEIGSDGPRTQDISLLIGKDERGGAYEASTVVYQTSAA